jgi:pyrroline-5-carboxylate reductase
MAEAMLAAFLRAGVSGRRELAVSELAGARRRYLKRRYRVAVAHDNPGTAAAADVLFLAVKPQQLGDLLAEIASVLTRRHLAVSIAAGRTTAWIEARLPRARVVRVMPNLPCRVGEGMSVLCIGKRARPADGRRVARLLAAFGKVLELPEKQFDAVTALSGSGPGFLAYVLGHMIRAAQREGLAGGDARMLAAQTMLGTARLLMEPGTDPEALVAAVASAKGTTAAGLAVLERARAGLVLQRTIRAAARRSRELSA